eukprot:m.173360 g.173360  ORF g.173360 m.173360 type:complete len:374 (-) comp31724_c2_seq5:103-1224(-)
MANWKTLPITLMLACVGTDVTAELENECQRNARGECEEASNQSQYQGPARDLNHSLISTDYDWGRFLSVHDIEWRSGGLESCEDKHEQCEEWAAAGECSLNPSFCHQNCPKSCNFCRSHLPKDQRCVRHPLEESSIKAPGGLNQMFNRIINDPYVQENYSPQVMSRDPWVVVFDNFVSEVEGDDLQAQLHGKWKRSSTVGYTKDGEMEEVEGGARTSSTAWCTMNPCSTSKVHKDIQKRVANLTGVDTQHMEFMQVLQYKQGEYYRAHHDNIGDHLDMFCGPRLLTAFFYFSSAGPGDGGATNFPQLGFQVEPKLGRMVLWPSMTDADNRKDDQRTTHEAMPVLGDTFVKYAANMWIHEFDYKAGYGLGCTGT